MIHKTAMCIIAVLMALAVNCSDRSVKWDEGASLGQFITMSVGQSSLVPGENLEIGFSEVTSDSRCPMNADCFWPGIGQVNLWVLQPGTDTVFVKPGIIGTTNVQKEGDHVPAHAFGYQFAVMGLTPYPPSQHPIAQSAYQTRIRVRKVGDNPQYPCVIVTNSRPETVLLDSYVLDAVGITGRRISISLSYSGGCENHRFGLYMAPAGFAKSNPVQADLYVRHYANGDACRAWISQTVSFNLEPVIELHRRHFGKDAPIIINVFDFLTEPPGGKLSVTYEPN